MTQILSIVFEILRQNLLYHKLVIIISYCKPKINKQKQSENVLIGHFLSILEKLELEGLELLQSKSDPVLCEI